MAEKKRSSSPSLGRIIFEEVGGEIMFGRGAEFVVRLLPDDWFKNIADVIPDEIASNDDLQDAIGRLLGAGARWGSAPPFIVEGVKTLSKETLEEIGLRAAEMPSDPKKRRAWVHTIVHSRPSAAMFNVEADDMTANPFKKKEEKKPLLSFTQRLADPSIDAAHLKRFDEWIDQRPDEHRARYLTLMGEAVAELDEVKRILALEDASQRMTLLEDLLRRAPKLGEKPKSLLQGAAERFGLGGITHNVSDSYQSVVKKIKDATTTARETVRKRRFGGY